MKPTRCKPRIIIHGGAGNITRDNLSSEAYQQYRSALLTILRDINGFLHEGGSALDAACRAVEQLENNGLFNSGHGAVYTTNGTHELEASVMVSHGYRKRGVGVMKVTKVKNPIKLAREILIRGEVDDGGGAHQHCQLHGDVCDRLAEQWGLDLVQPSYYWTRRRWDEHRRGLGLCYDDETYKRDKQLADSGSETIELDFDPAIATNDPSWDGKEYLPQGTVGTVVLDNTGILCVATSTGGITNKLPGRIGDTPTIGAGFWAEQWQSTNVSAAEIPKQQYPSSSLVAMVSDCIPGLSGYMSLPALPSYDTEPKVTHSIRGVAMSGTGNGDSFLRVNAVRTAAAMARFTNSETTSGATPLQKAVTAIAGPHGELQRSAEDRWRRTGEGEGGIIGIDFANGQGSPVADFNCGGMFRAWVDDQDKERMAVFREEI